MPGIFAHRKDTRVIQTKPRALSATWIHRAPNEQWVEDRIGRESLTQFLGMSSNNDGMNARPIPILGTGAFAYRGQLVHAVADEGGGRRSSLGGMMGLVEHVMRPKLILDAMERVVVRNRSMATAGFASLSDLISEMTAGAKAQQLFYQKVGIAGVAGRSSTLWYAAGYPGVGATAAALAAGTNHTNATTGAIKQTNAAGGDQLHLVGAEGSILVAGMNLILYDRIWAGEPTITSAVAQTVTMTPTRYATTGASGLSKGNTVHCEVRVVLGAATPTLTLNYVDDQGNAAENAATVTGITAAAVPTFPYGSATLPNQFIPLNAGDVGVSDIIQWTQSASYVSGSYAIVLGHPLMMIPAVALANTGYIRDGINSSINLQRVYDDACLALLEPAKGATTATTFYGMLTLASG